MSKFSSAVGLTLLQQTLFSNSAQAATWQKVKSATGAASTWRKLSTTSLGSGRFCGWGSNTALGVSGGGNKSTPVVMSTITNAIHISGGQFYNLALLANGCAVSWGDNVYGMLGNNTTTFSSTPVAICGLSNVATFAIGQVQSSFAVLNDGRIMAWGVNNYGQLGDNTTTNRSTPVYVCGITNAVAVSSRDAHTVALLSNGTVMAWGVNNAGQLGNGTTVNSSTPVATCLITSAVAVGATTRSSTALLANGRVMTWGQSNSGVLGIGSGTNYCTPVTVCTITNAIAIMPSNASIFALLADGTVMAWGSNGTGRLGDNSITDRSVPVFVCGISNAVAVTAGDAHAAAMLMDGTVMSWGKNDYGQLGSGTCYTTNLSMPSAVCSISGAAAITSGTYHSAVI